jgi:hypothetical protein
LPPSNRRAARVPCRAPPPPIPSVERPPRPPCARRPGHRRAHASLRRRCRPRDRSRKEAVTGPRSSVVVDQLGPAAPLLPAPVDVEAEGGACLPLEGEAEPLPRLPPCPPWTAANRRRGRFRRAAIDCVTRKSSLPRAGCPRRLPSPSIRCWIWRPPAILLSQEVNPGADQGRSHHQPPWLGRRSSRRRLLLPYGGALQEHAEHHRCSLGGQVLLCLSQVGVCNHESPRQP